MAKKERIIFLKGERLLWVLIVILALFNVIGRSISMTMLSKTNYDVEKLRSKISSQLKTNESLNMKINELASLDNVENVASSYGLAYNNSNVKIISE